MNSFKLYLVTNCIGFVLLYLFQWPCLNFKVAVAFERLIPVVRVHLLEWYVTLHLYDCVLQVEGNGCTHYLLMQYWVNLRVLAEER